MNRGDLQRLAEARLEDARVLLAGRRYAAAYYLAGYAIECGLKACIAKRVKRYDFPSSANFSREVFTHRLVDLVRHAELREALADKIVDSSEFELNWGVVAGWSEESRYDQKTRREAEALLNAITDVPDGVMAWIRLNW